MIFSSCNPASVDKWRVELLQCPTQKQAPFHWKSFHKRISCKNEDDEGYDDQVYDDKRHDVVVHLSERQIEERTKLCKSISWTMRDLGGQYHLGLFNLGCSVFMPTIAHHLVERVLINQGCWGKEGFWILVFMTIQCHEDLNLTLTHASQSCQIQRCTHSHWKD